MDEFCKCRHHIEAHRDVSQELVGCMNCNCNKFRSSTKEELKSTNLNNNSQETSSRVFVPKPNICSEQSPDTHSQIKKELHKEYDGYTINPLDDVKDKLNGTENK